MRRPDIGLRCTCLALGLAFRQQPDQPRQPLDLPRLRRHHVRQIVDRAGQVGHLFLQRLTSVHDPLLEAIHHLG